MTAYVIKLGSAAALTAAVFLVAACACSAASSTGARRPDPAEDRANVTALDVEFQAAVKRNDAATMDRILADDFILVTGRGATYDKQDLLREAREETTRYERQDVETRTVRVWGDTAVVTALLWIKGVRDGKPIDYKLWYSDSYARTPEGWRYVLGQASLPLPAPPEL